MTTMNGKNMDEPAVPIQHWMRQKVSSLVVNTDVRANQMKCHV